MYRVITETLVEVWEHGKMETLLKSTTFYNLSKQLVDTQHLLPS